MIDVTRGVVVEEFVELKPNLYSFLIDDSSEHKKAKDVKKNVVARKSYSEYKDVLLNNKCLRRSMNRIQRKNRKIETYKINKISL